MTKTETSRPDKLMVKKMKDSNTAIIVIDVQEKLITVINNKDKLLNNLEKIIDAGILLNLKILYTEQNPSKLGRTIPNLLRTGNHSLYSKMDFSCSSCKEILDELKANKIKNLLLCGIESHVCVQQTALDFLSEGFNIFIPIDAIGSRHLIDHETSIRRLGSSGAIISTTEAVIFEWCKGAGRAEFKQISKIIKGVSKT